MEIRRRTRASCTALIRSASSVGVSEPRRERTDEGGFRLHAIRATIGCKPSPQPEEAHDQPPHLHRAPCRHGRSPNRAWSQHVTAKTIFYATTGPELTVFDVDAGDAALQKRSAVTLPANVQYAWRIRRNDISTWCRA